MKRRYLMLGRLGAMRLAPFSVKRVLSFFVIALLFSGSLTAFCAEDTQQVLKDYFDKNDKFANVAGKPLDLLSNPKYADFAQQYTRALVVVRVANEVQANGSFEGFRIAAEEIGKAALKACLPRLANALDWFGWVKTGMELFKVFVFDPMLEQMNVDAYNKTRDAGFSCEEAFSMSIHAFGHMRQKAIERFREEYGPGVFKEGSKDELLPRWEAKLMEFANAWFEQQYQKYLWEKIKKEMVTQKIAAEGNLAALDAKLLEALNEKREVEPVGKIEVDGKTPSPPSQQEDWNSKWKGKTRSTVTVEGIAPVVREGEFEFRTVREGQKIRIIGADREFVYDLTPSNPNAAMFKEKKKETFSIGWVDVTDKRVVFLRDGRLYLTIHQEVTGHTTIPNMPDRPVTEIHDTIGIADRVK